jgi:hypothetical protein
LHFLSELLPALLLEFEDDAAAIAVVDIEDEIATESSGMTLGKG